MYWYVWLIICAALIFAAVVTYFTALNKKRKKVSEILRYGKESEKTVRYALITRFGASRVFSSFYLPCINKENESYTEIDNLVITKGGIVVIEVKSHNGKIDNRDDYWKQYYGDKYVEFYNPIKQNAGHVRAVADILHKENVYNVPIYNVVVFTSRNVSFAKRYDEIFSFKSMMSKIHDICHANVLSYSEMRRLQKIIAAWYTNSRQAQKKHQEALRQYSNS